MEKDRKFISSKIVERVFDDGAFLDVSISIDDLMECYRRKGKNGKEYIKLIIRERKEPSPYGDTHYIYEDPSETKLKKALESEK